ncbi:tetratricopeptide repeat protein [Lusitaniella coriacea LEGE 07157]|uniref:Tetratricopeptide repeat protein n=1 Tax=Lusitaniella coriacea LEGE 07157 TaxID=945747 RepID=A0A8J7J4A8_9CYAN|nr:tetratricopeptide repeat protein [Lusitaniella coriacea]MBE9117484.1 tetratricopeptide repeat protein [Lusitaniella coriacea LEGE 07157]
MPIITIREQQATAHGFTATVSINNAGEYPIEITNPFNDKEESELEWYFENWLAFPQLGQVKAKRAKDSVSTYGEQLFEQVFGNRRVYSKYENLKPQLSQVSIEIASKTPEFQALHWEALKDPDLPRPLAVDCTMVRKSLKPTATTAFVQPSQTINLLVVVARPDEEEDVSYRTISRPLYETIENAQLRVNIELLRPGTFETLSKHLEEKGEGYYHILHFDGHGALMTYAQIEEENKKREKNKKPERYIEKGRYGNKRGDLKPFEGINAFLSFEGETQGQVDLVEAAEFAKLLTGKGIPVCLLNACQSGKQMQDSRETSLGSRLMAAGMQVVVAMGYSVTVSAAKVMMQELYEQLFAGKEMTEAIRWGRKELYSQKERKAYFNQTIELEDWLLPVVYANQAVNFNLREFTPEEEEKYYEEQGSLYRFPLPEYGFFGRDLEILKIEKALLRHNVLLLRGMGGTGKTTLLNYLREWWQRTQFVRDVFYFGYDEKAWNLQQILFEIGKRVDFDQTMDLADQESELVEKFRVEEPYVLILDNLESVTGQELAIQNTLPEEERNKIRDFLGRLVGGKTKVVLGSRGGEEWLQQATFRQNRYVLRGLDAEARSELAEKILERQVGVNRVEAIRQDEDFTKLMKLLAGYPLAMEVVLGNLSRQTPTEVLEALQAADVDLDTGSEEKTKSILKCVEYSHSNLSPEAQKLLVCLAPFSGFIDRTDIPRYVAQLQELEPFKEYEFEKFDGAIQEAIHWGLLSPALSPNPSPNSGRGEQENEQLLLIQPLFPYFLKAKAKELDETTQDALWEGFKNHYRGLGGYYQQLMESKDAQERQLGIAFCRWEYENLYNALLVCLEKQESVDIFFCLFYYFYISQDIQSNLKLCEFVYQAHQNYPIKVRQGNIGYEMSMVLNRLANCYLATQNYQKAREIYKENIEFDEQLQGISEQQKRISQASTYHQLGIVAQQLREWEDARGYYQQALSIKIEYNDRHSQASTYHQLGRVAQELREWEDARGYYQQALSLFIEYNDRYSQASTYHNLGRVAQELREWEDARGYYQQALSIKIEYNDRHSQASTYHNLGIVAQELREWEDARGYYQQALSIKIEYNDRHSQARIYHCLGIVAQKLREWEDARGYYQQALSIKIEYNDRHSQARTYCCFGNVAIELKEFEEAKTNHLQALQIWAKYNDEYSIKTFSLPRIAQIYQATQDESLLTTLAEMFGVSVEEMRTAISQQ